MESAIASLLWLVVLCESSNEKYHEIKFSIILQIWYYGDLNSIAVS